MSEPNRVEWQRRRSAFNHQWLKNRLLSALDTGHNVIEGRVRGNSYLREIMEIDVSEWLDRREELATLLEEFETEMSPKCVLDNNPLSEWNYDEKDAVADLIHELWLARYAARASLSAARRAAADIDLNYNLLRNKPPLKDDGTICPEFASCFERFRTACRTLSQAIEKLPNRILVT